MKESTQDDYPIPPLFKILGIEEIDNGAAELGYCAILIEAHVQKVKSGTIDKESYKVLRRIQKVLNGVIPL